MGSSLSKRVSESHRRRLTDTPPLQTPLPLPTPPIHRSRALNLNSRLRKFHPFGPPATFFSKLPNELVLEIAKHLPTTRDLCALMMVNKRLAILLDHLLSKILLPLFQRSSGQHPLFSSRRRYPDALVLRVLRLDVDLNETFCDCIGSPSWCRCMPALHTAITYSNVTMVDSLLRHGARIDAPYGTKGDNAVHLAIDTANLCSGYFKVLRENNMTILGMVLGGGQLQTMNNPASMNNRGQTWLSHAVRTCSREHMTMVEPFLSPGLSVDVPDRQNYYTPLHFAVLNNRVDLVALLLKHGADYQTTDSRGRTPYQSACNRPNRGIMDLFFRQDVTMIDIVVNDSGETAELVYERHVGRLSLDGSEDSEYVQSVWEKKQFLVKLMKLVEARRNCFIPDRDLQIYYNSL